MASTASSARRVDGVEGAVMNLEAEQDLARGVGRLPGSRASEPSRHTSKRLPSPRNAPSQDVRVHGNIPPKTERCPVWTRPRAARNARNGRTEASNHRVTLSTRHLDSGGCRTNTSKLLPRARPSHRSDAA